MAEYAGYVASTPVDFGAISSGLMANRLAVEKLKKTEKSDALKLLQKQQAADEKARIQERKEESEDEKILRSDLDRVKAAENLPEKSFNTFATEGLGNIKGKIFELNKLKKEGKITNQDYLININNLQDQWNQFTAGVKSFKTNLEGLTKSVQEGKTSKIGAGLVGMYANTGQLSNKVLGVKDEKGISRLQQYTVDNDGNRIEDETITNIGTLANPSLFFDGNVDYNKKFEEANKAIGAYKIEKNLTTIESQKQNPEYNTLLEQQITGIISDDLDKARLLTENLGYEFYFTQQQKDALLKKGVDEKKMVEFKLNDKGAYSPIITKDQNAVAYDYTKNALEGRMDYSKTQEKPASIRVNTGDKKDADTKSALRTYRTATKAYNDLIGSNSASVLTDIANLFKGSYDYGAIAEPIKKNGKIVGINVYERDSKGQKDKERGIVDTISNIKDFFRVYTPADRKGKEIVDYETAREALGLDGI